MYKYVYIQYILVNNIIVANHEIYKFILYILYIKK